jgi:predicted GTPase
MRRRIVILGAAGRDFHNFNMLYRDREAFEVIAFTATQIPNIEGRRYPKELAGKLYPEGIPIESESDLVRIIREGRVDEAVFSYSDVSHEYVMHLASRVQAAGATFSLPGRDQTMLRSSKLVIAVCSARTGAGKSQTTRRISRLLRARGKKVVVVRHPMPYGDLVKQRLQRFATYDDMKAQHCTIEEMEEYEPHIVEGTIVYAGVDYEAILREAEKEAEVILWDGGNNDTSFYDPTLQIVVVDPHRAGHELTYYPGETNLLVADVVVVNKEDSASLEDIEKVRDNVYRANPRATLIDACSPLFVDRPEAIRGKRALVIEDGPTVTHGGMRYGAGVVAARKYGARELVDPRPFAVRSIAETFEKYPGIGTLLPAMGYGDDQVGDLQETIRRSDAEVVVVATPIDLGKLITIDQPSVRVRYELQEIGTPTLEDVLDGVSGLGGPEG